ncbi:MAG: hypothetical protein KJT03_14675, partial [Verrucomicrobiae bacterium]|nr:hypothetical protein [Verrucomicrobiae bacterium]
MSFIQEPSILAFLKLKETEIKSALTSLSWGNLIPRMSYAGEIWSLVCALSWAIGVIFFRLAVLGVPPLLMSLFKNSFACILFSLTWLVLPAVDEQTK